MSFNLHVTIGGLCLFVEDNQRRDGRKLLHVLMPQTGHGPHAEHPGHTNVELHRACLLYPFHHTLPGLEATTTPVIVELANAGLDLSRLKTESGWTADLSGKQVFEVGELVGRRVERPLLDDPSTGVVLSRVTMGAGTVDRYNRGARWRVAGSPPVHMTISLEWKIQDIDGDVLILNFYGMNGSAPPAPLTLYPQETATGREIRLWIYHSPRLPGSVPPVASRGTPPMKGDLAHHASAFYSLLGLVPVFEDWPDDPLGGGGAAGTAAHAFTLTAGSPTHTHGAAGASPHAGAQAHAVAAADPRRAGAGVAAAAAFLGEELTCIGGRAVAVPQT